MKEKGWSMEIAILRLGRIPYVVTNNRKMAVWSDVKEVLLWCANPKCNVLLNALKVLLCYPASETAMHPCSQLEQLLFLKHLFVYITHGTLLVDLDSLRDATKLTVLYNMVRQKHSKSKDSVIINCTKMLTAITEKYANTSFKIPLTSASSKRFLPAVRRLVKNTSSKLNSEKNCLKYVETPGSKNEPVGSENPSSRTLVPLALLSKLYSGCDEFLCEVARLYMLRRCAEENLHSICQCTVEEGIQLSRFLASQNGYERQWLCLTSASLMMSWSEFWIGLERMSGGIVVAIPSDVCVITLNCQTELDQQQPKGKVIPKCTVPTELSPPLSPITVMTKNVQCHLQHAPFKHLSEVSQTSQILDTGFTLNKQPSFSSVRTVSSEALSKELNEAQIVYKDDMNIASLKDQEKFSNTSAVNGDALHEVLVKCEGKISEDKVSDEDKMINATETEKDVQRESVRETNDNEDLAKGVIDRKKPIKVGKTDRKQVPNKDRKRLHNTSDTKILTGRNTRTMKTKGISNIQETCHKSPRLRRHISKKPKLKDGGVSNSTISSNKGIKSRLRGSYQEKTKVTKERKSYVHKKDINNSAPNNTLPSAIAKSGSGDTNSSEEKIVKVTNEFSAPEQNYTAGEQEVETAVSPSLGMKVELPMSEISQYDLGDIAQKVMEGIQVSITPKKKPGTKPEDVSEETNQDNIGFPISKYPKKKIETLQTVKAERKTLKIPSAQLKDEIPSNLLCSTKIPDVANRFPGSTRTGSGNEQKKFEVVNQVGKLNSENEKISGTYFTPTFKILTQKQIELTAPMLKGPAPNVVQDSRIYPYKPVKFQEDSILKKQTESLNHPGKIGKVVPILERTKVSKNSSSKPLKQNQNKRSLEESVRRSPDVQESFVTSVVPNKNQILHEEIVNSLKKQAATSLYSVSGNRIERKTLLAEGKTMKTFERNRDQNSSEFLKERITMWKDEVERNLLHNCPGRPSKSADFIRKPSIYTQRPKSSINSSGTFQLNNGSSSIKTALGAVFSRGRERVDKQIRLHPSPKEAFLDDNESVSKTDHMANSNHGINNHCLPGTALADSVTVAQNSKEHDTSVIGDMHDVQNYGSSSSSTPDIYDEFARKKKPKPPRQELFNIKSKPVPITVLTSSSQLTLQTQTQTAVKACTKPNYHTVGYISDVKATDQVNQYGDPKQMYQHRTDSQPQNLPCSSVKNALLPQQYDSTITSSTLHSLESQPIAAHKNDNQIFFSDNEKKSLTPNLCQSSTRSKSAEPLRKHTSRVQSFPSMHYITSKSGHWQNPYTVGMQDEEKVHFGNLSENDHMERGYSTENLKNSIADKMAFCTRNDLKLGRIESLDYVCSIQSVLGTNHVCSSAVKATKPMESSSDSLQQEKGTVYSKTESRLSMPCIRSKSASENTSVRREEHIKPVRDVTREKNLSKVSTQLYYKVPNDDMYYLVSENMMIPRHAQFFIQSDLDDHTNKLPQKSSVPNIIDERPFSENLHLKQSLNIPETSEESIEAETKHLGINSNYDEKPLNERKGAALSVEEGTKDPTFDSVIKASEEFIDKNKQIKYIISETKLPLEKSKDDEGDYKPENISVVKDTADSKQTLGDSNRSDEAELPKVIIPSLGLCVRRYNPGPKKTFKEVVNEKRAEKRQLQQELAKKQFWNSANLNRRAQHNSVQNSSQYYQIQSSKAEGKVKDNSSRHGSAKTKQQSEIDKAKVNNLASTVNAKFDSAEQTPSSTASMTEKDTKCISDVVNRTKKESGSLNAGISSDYAVKQNQHRDRYVDRARYQQTSKPVKIFPRTRNPNSHQETAEDCANKILPALRRLSIEKCHKQDEKEHSRREARQCRLRTTVVKQSSGMSVSSDKSREHKISSFGSVTKFDKCSEGDNRKNKKEKGDSDTFPDNCSEKIPVLISIRDDLVDNIPENSEENNVFHTNVHEEPSQKLSKTDFQTDLQQADILDVSRSFKQDAQSNQNIELNGETFITQYSSRGLALFGAMETAQTYASSIDSDRNKYLGIPYFQETNSNMNNTECCYPWLDSTALTHSTLQQDPRSLQEQENIKFSDVSSDKFVKEMDSFNNIGYNVNTNFFLDHQTAGPTVETNTLKNASPRQLQHANEFCYTWNGIDENGTDCCTNYFDCNEDMVPGITAYIHSSMTDYEHSEMLLDNSLDTNWLKIGFKKDTEGNLNDVCYFTQADEYETFVDKDEGNENEDRMIDGQFTYYEYDSSQAIEQPGESRLFDSSQPLEQTVESRLFENTNMSSACAGRQTVKEDTYHALEKSAENGTYQYVYETAPISDLETNTAAADLTALCFGESDFSSTLIHYIDKDSLERTTDTEQTKSHVCEYTTSLINEDWDHQFDSPQDTLEQPSQILKLEEFSASNTNDFEVPVFLDETDCAQEICIGDDDKQGVDDGLNQSYENGIVCDGLSQRNSIAEIRSSSSSEEKCENNNTEDVPVVTISDDGKHNSKNIRGTEKVSQNAKTPETQTNEDEERQKFSKDVDETSRRGENKKRAKGGKGKKIKNHKKKQTACECSETELHPTQETYSPSESEVEAFFLVVEKKTGIEYPNLTASENVALKTSCTSKSDRLSDENSSGTKPKMTKVTPGLHDNERSDGQVSSISKKKDLHVKNIDPERVVDNENVDDDFGNGNEDDNDDEDYNDDDYNPEDDSSSESGSESEIEFDSESKKNKVENATRAHTNNSKNKCKSKKKHEVSLDKIRKSFQKKYDIKNSSTVNKWKQRSVTGKTEGLLTNPDFREEKCCNTPNRKEQSIVREYCSKKRGSCIHLEKLDFEKTHTSGENGSDREKTYGKKYVINQQKQSHRDRTVESDSSQRCRKKRIKRMKENVTQDEGDNSDDEKKTAAAEGFIKTQKLYYEILRKSSIGAVKEEVIKDVENREDKSSVADLSDVIEAVPVNGERVITKALTEAEKALEGTGSLDNIHNEDDGPMIQDLVNQCSYQMIEDEDHIQLGGIAYFKDYSLPFIYINGYKFTPLKDALTIFSPSCCITACTIPRSVLQKCKPLVKSLSTWEQVYKLELIKMKKGPAIKTGDLLVKLDALLVQLPEIIEQIDNLHVGTKLKRSKKCNISEYKTLKSKFM